MQRTRRLLAWAAAFSFPAAAAQPVCAQLTFQPHLFEAQSGRRVQAELGWLEVPENRSNPSAHRIRLAVMRLPSTSSSPGPPIVHLAGGPGNSAIQAGRGKRLAVFQALSQVADVILLDQRGTGLSEPDLQCRGVWSLPLDRPGDPDAILQEARRQARSCAASLREKGRDLAGFNGREIALDLEDLRKALGVEQISLLGFSWGTQLALTAVRMHEERIARAILAGVVGQGQRLHRPQAVDSWLQQVQSSIEADPLARQRFPDFPGLVRKVVKRLRRQPVVVEAPVPLAHRTARLAIGEFDLQMFTVQALGSADSVRRLPLIYEAFSRGDFSALTSAVQRLRRGWLGSALPYAIKCSAAVPAHRLEEIRRQEGLSPLGRALNFPFPDICQAWGLDGSAPAKEMPSGPKRRYRTPVLLISGTLDARTPPSNAQEVAGHFTDPVQLVIANAGHDDDLFLSSPRILELMLAFLRGETVSETRISIPAPDFLK
ncbi:MAG: alpha/beta fold hydrolase [Acidobacteriota bacterium]